MADAGNRTDEDCLSTPTKLEEKNLRRVCDNIPRTIFLVAVAELAERFTYRCITAPMQNYIENAYNDPLRRGALGQSVLKDIQQGQATATSINYFFTCWCFMAPIIGAIIADGFLGRFRTICLGTGVAIGGVLILFVTSFPFSIKHGAGLPGLIVALILIGLGFGGIKSNVAPLIADQYARKSPRVRTLAGGEKVRVDPDLTVQTIYSRYYWVINIGSLSVILASWLELKVSFWAAFLLPFCFWILPVSALIMGRGKYTVQKPKGSVLVKAMRVLWLGFKRGRNLNAAKPSAMAQTHPEITVPWDDAFVDELKRALIACSVYAEFCRAFTVVYFPFSGFATDNPTATWEKFVYPTLRRYHLTFKPISRIAAGYLVMACAIGNLPIASMLQPSSERILQRRWKNPK
ncbi:uncharacterized protein N7511_005123 [Penicillium nucicola]|uniref:uncharacterized protein n=1 Tax=Penicillium nucicola TaxID=1850975 RepID=UPI0025457B71|nr:uncharacterized protein N7511_005123 [Penicillium nucicola]KAJ5761741.1 hypothetical protein N7511_005123 [Penicillium nucicola]